LDAACARCLDLSDELEDAARAAARDRAELSETITSLVKQLKMKNFVIEHFVPRDEAAKIESRLKWDDASREWVLEGVNLAAKFCTFNSIDVEKGNEAADVRDVVEKADVCPRQAVVK
jgi:hypothetical protein